MISSQLHNRLLVESAVMMNMYPYFRFYEMENVAYVRGWYNSTSGKNYQLKLIFSDYYPDTIPELYILSPEILWKHDSSERINNLNANHQFHTLTSDMDGHIKICHYGSEKWHAACTSIGVMTRGLLWIEAYEDHLKTGKDIDTIFNQWKRRKQWKENLKANDWKELLETCHKDNILMTDYSLTINPNLLGQALFPEILKEKSKSLLKISSMGEFKLL